MKKISTLTIAMLVLLNVNGLAQKPLKRQSSLFAESQERYFSEKKKAFDAEKEEFRQKLAEAHDVRRLEFGGPSAKKAAQALPLEKLDSIVDYYWSESQMKFNLGYRNWFEYDSLGRNTMDTWLGADSDTTFPDYGGKYQVVYNMDGDVSEYFQWEWYPGKGFVEDEHGTLEYDANGNNLVEFQERWDTTKQIWYLNQTDTAKYDGNNNRIERTTYYYDTMMLAWDPGYRQTYEYNASNKVTVQYDWNWNYDSSRWEGSNRTEYFYNEMDLDTARISSYWDGQAWYQSSKDVTGRNARGARTFEAYYYWDGESQWIPSSRYDYTLDGNDLVTEEIDYYHDGMKLFIERKYTYIRDAKGNIIEETSYDYDTTSMQYTGDWRDQYTYDPTVDWDQLALPLEIAEEGEDPDNIYVYFSKPVEFVSFNYDTTTMTWDTNGIENLYWSPLDPDYVPPVTCDADFSFREMGAPDKIEFMDGSSGEVTSWYWTFGDGSSSTLQNPVHVYQFPGTYKVTLSTSNADGSCTSTIVKQVKAGNAPCNAEFTMMVDTVGLKIQVTSTSQGTNLKHSWNFGDGRVSNAASPQHTYQFPGTYDVTLTIQNDIGTCMDRYSLPVRVGTAICKAGFNVFVDSASMSAKFRAETQNPANTYRWEFGDGSVAKTANVEKTFTHPGYYTAKLTVSNSAAQCVNSFKTTVLVGRPSPGGKAGFIYVTDGNSVKFNDRSLGENLQYLWDFNDGSTSTDQNPTNDYTVAGYYNVCLTVFTADGNRNTHCEQIFAGMETTGQCLAQFDYKLSDNQLGIVCYDRSAGDPDTWLWTYSDGFTTTAQNPSWTASSPGYELIRQSISNSTNGCRDDAFALINMGAAAKLKAGIGYVVDTSDKKADTYPVDFVGVSLGDAGKLKWDFGDGTTDTTSINPQHVYSVPGVYTVCLTITNTTTGEEDKSCEQVTVGWAVSTNDFGKSELNLRTYPNPFSDITRAEFTLERDSEIELAVYDLMGRKVRTVAKEFRNAGAQSIEISGDDLGTGNYYLVLKSGDGTSRAVISVVK